MCRVVFLSSPAVHVALCPLGRGLVELGGGVVGGWRRVDEACNGLLECMSRDFTLFGEGLLERDDGV